MATVRYYIGVLLVVGLPPGVLWWFIIHPFVGFWRKLGVRTSLWTVGTLMVAFLVGLVFVRDPMLGPDLGTSWALAGLGIALIVAAGVMGLRRQRHLTWGILSGAPELQADGRGGTLLTKGPYAVIRHPRYIEVVAGVFGYACVANYLGGYLMASLTIPILHLIVLMEERELARRFGRQWDEYSMRVPRYVPRRLWRGSRLSGSSDHGGSTMSADPPG